MKKTSSSTSNTVSSKTSSSIGAGENVIPNDLRDPVGPLKAVPVPKPANVKPLRTGPKPKRAPVVREDDRDDE